MPENNDKMPKQTGKRAERQAREAAALRLNLKRRKAQIRARDDQPAEEPEDAC